MNRQAKNKALGLTRRERTAEDIRHALRLKGLTLTDISKEIGCSLSLVSKVALGDRKTPFVRKTLATRINQSVSDIWPPKHGGSPMK
ncbi:helix-turn-helix domain-containing protein [Aliiroseovarius sp. 2305UL8-7]|uniref:helix-turn-helix domain-containing protein n=1 Tax=Aliiroseovarius conchicola TaxID=3121637 RepID=UPI0035277423